jgi:hypothetical protein
MMTESRRIVLGAAIMAVASMLLFTSLSFAISFSSSTPPSSASSRFLGQLATEQEVSPSSSWASNALCISVVVGLCGLTVRRTAISRRATSPANVNGSLGAPKDMIKSSKQSLSKEKYDAMYKVATVDTGSLPYPLAEIEVLTDEEHLEKYGVERSWVTPGMDAAAEGQYPPAGIAGIQRRPAFADGLVGCEYVGFAKAGTVGRYEYDPIQIAARYPEHLPWYREAELKHGRVCMLAFVGFLAQDAFRIPIAPLDDPSIDILNAHNKLVGPGVGEGAMWWVLIFCAVIESLRFKDLGLAFEKLTLENAGDLNFGKGFLPKTEDGKLQMQIKELKNGRLAMLAVGGIMTQAGLWGNHHFPFV